MTEPIRAVGTRQPTLVDDPRGRSVAVCCSGGGIRSAAFNLGALQVLQDSPVYPRVKTVTAVSGGSYIAAAHALAERRLGDQLGAQPAYALGTPEETNLRDHSRYLVPDGKTTLFGVLGILLGLVVNVLLVSSVLFVAGHVLGWGLRATGILTGLDAERPHLRLGPYWVVCLSAVLVGVLVSWGTYVYRRRPEPRSIRVSWWLLVGAAVAATLVVAAPAAVTGLYDVGRKDTGTAGTVVRGVGFSTGGGCASVARQAAAEPSQRATDVCGAPATNATVAADNGDASRRPGAFGGGFLAFLAALLALVRTASGKVRTYGKDLAEQPGLKKAVDGLGRFARDRFAPWLGTALVVVAAVVLSLRWLGEGAAGGAADGHLWHRQLTHVVVVGLLFVAIKATVDINRTSLHRYYRDRLASAYATVRGAGGAGEPAGEARLSSLAGGERELVVCAAANCNCGGSLPPGRGAVSFTFTGRSVGLSVLPKATDDDRGRRVETSAYEAFLNRFTLFDAVAVSGAAVAPLMGKMTQPSKRVLFALGNIRLGVWLPAPKQLAEPSTWLSRARRRFWQPDLRRLWAEMAGTLHIDGRWLYVTDGGHYDNLGLVEALRRRPDAVVVFDAAGDQQGGFSTLGQAVALSRTECACDITIDPTHITPGADREVPTTVTAGYFSYRDDPDTVRPLLYAKLGVSPDHPWDVRAYLRNHPTFPTAATIQQLYDGDEFEAYRAMGQATATALLQLELPTATLSEAPPVQAAS